MPADSAHDQTRALRDQLADRLRRDGHVTSPLVEEAFRAVPRHLFLPGVAPEKVYCDESLPTKWGADGLPLSSSSQPAIMAVMLEQLGLEPGQRVLEIGAGTGYNAALIALVVGEGGTVTTVDIDEELADQARAHLDAVGFSRVRVVCGDGALGHPELAPYDRVLLTIGAWDVAPAWLEQLAPHGRLVLPLSLRGVQRSVAFERAGGHLRGVSIRDCGFMCMRGGFRGPECVRQLEPDAGVFVELGEDRPLDTQRLYAALSEPGEEVPSGVRVTVSDVWGGLGLWLALHEPDLARLFATGGAAERGLVPALIAVPGQVGTVAIVGERALAALVRHENDADVSGMFEVGARAFGADGGDSAHLAHRLTRQVAEWDRNDRPSTSRLRIDAYPPNADVEAAAIIDKRHTRLALDWS